MLEDESRLDLPLLLIGNYPSFASGVALNFYFMFHVVECE